MSAVQAGAWILLVSSIAIASWPGAAPAGPPPTHNGFRIVTADLHVHAFLGDGALAPWDIRREARRRGLNAVAITNHNQMYAARLDRALFSNPPPPLTFAAEELTAPGYHLTAIGIRAPLDWRLTLADAIRVVHAQGGVAIAAHPVGPSARDIDDEVLSLLDGVEVAHPIAEEDPRARAKLDALYARAVRVKPTIAAIGASDFHFGAPVGSYRTLVLARDFTHDGVLDGIRAGRTVAVDGVGKMYGPAEWRDLVNAAPAGIPAPDRPRDTLTTAAAWVAMLVLVVLGTRGSRP